MEHTHGHMPPCTWIQAQKQFSYPKKTKSLCNTLTVLALCVYAPVLRSTKLSRALGLPGVLEEVLCEPEEQNLCGPHEQARHLKSFSDLNVLPSHGLPANTASGVGPKTPQPSQTLSS